MSETLQPTPMPDASEQLDLNQLLEQVNLNGHLPAQPEAGQERAYVGRHTAEYFADSAAAETPQSAAESHDRFVVRAADRVASMADRVAQRANDYAARTAAQPTLKERTQTTYEHGKEVAANVGASIASAAVSLDDKLSTKYNRAFDRIEGGLGKFFKDKAEQARTHKNNLVERMKNRREKLVLSSERAAKVGAEVLAVSALVAVGTGVLAVRGAKELNRAAARKAKQQYENVTGSVTAAATTTKERFASAATKTKESARRKVEVGSGKLALVAASGHQTRANLHGRLADRAERRANKAQRRLDKRTARVTAAADRAAAIRAKAEAKVNGTA